MKIIEEALLYLKVMIGVVLATTGGRKRGQMTIIGVIMGVITLFTYLVLHPILTSFITAANLTGTDALLAEAIPTFIFLMIIMSFAVYALPHRQ